MINACTMNELYRKLCTKILQHGARVDPRHSPTLELTNVQLTLESPLHRFVNLPSRAMDMRYCIGEFCFYLSGSTDLSFINRYSSFWNKISDDGEHVNSAYGSRLFPDSLNYAIEVLKTDVNSRKAVMPIYNLSDSKPSLDNPCTMFLQLLIRDNRLDCYTYMRSNDVWLGVPYDIAFFTMVQEIAFVKLLSTYQQLHLGSYYHTVTSMHAYEHDLDKLEDIVVDPELSSLIAPKITSLDLAPWFKHLLDVEQNRVSSAIPTDFQLWCENFL